MNTKDLTFSKICEFFPPEYSAALSFCAGHFNGRVYEIRLYAGKAAILVTDCGIFFCGKNGELSSVPSPHTLRPDSKLLFDILNRASSFSLYTYEKETGRSFMTVNGLRFGICGMEPDSRIRPGGISSLNIRLPCYERLAGDAFTDALVKNGGGVLVAGRPASGKTTLLKKIIFSLASGQAGRYYKTSVIDARGEFADYVFQTPEIITADVVSYPDKYIAVETALRLLSPECIVCDELGDADEAEKLLEGVNSGVRIMASIHAGGIKELLRRPQFCVLFGSGVFDSVVLLSEYRTGHIEKIFSAGEIKSETELK